MSHGTKKARIVKLLSLASLSLSMANVSAEELLPSMDYIEAGYVDVEIDNFLIFNEIITNRMKGIYVDGRYSLFSDFYINLGIKTTRSDGHDFNFSQNINGSSVNLAGSTDLDFDEQRLGFGYAFEPTDHWRITADINYLRQRYTVDRTGTATVTGNIDDIPIRFRTIADGQVTLDGGLARIGTEYAVNTALTLQGNVTYQNISGNGFRLKGYRLNVGANYKLSDDWSLTGNYQISNESALYLGVRYSF